jgi:hypothetical protein
VQGVHPRGLDVADLKLGAIRQSSADGAQTGLLDGLRREVDADERGAGRPGDPQARSTRPASEIGEGVGRADPQLLSDAAQLRRRRVAERVDLLGVFVAEDAAPDALAGEAGGPAREGFVEVSDEVCR